MKNIKYLGTNLIKKHKTDAKKMQDIFKECK